MKAPKILRNATLRAIDTMAATKTASHSFNIINPHAPGTKAATMWLLFVPSRMDQAMFDALKPIFDRELGPGSLVEPGKEAARASLADS